MLSLFSASDSACGTCHVPVAPNLWRHVALRRGGGSYVVVLLLATLGCSSLGGSREAVPQDVAAGRELSRQGVAAMERGEWQEAETLFREALETSPSDTAALRHLAEVLWRRGETQDSLVKMEAAQRLDPNDARLTVRTGEMYLATGAHDKALLRAEQAIGLDPTLAAGWALRGRAAWQQGEIDQAVADLQRSLQFAPAETDALLDLANLYRQSSRHQRCLTTLHHLLDTYPPGAEPQLPLYLEGLTLAELERWDEAAESLVAASRQGPANAEILFHLARVEAEAGRLDDATATIHQALAADASHQASRQLLAQLAQQPASPSTALK